MNRFAPMAVLAFGLTSAHAEAQAPEAAIRAANDYSQAVMGSDCSEVIRLSGVLARHPEATEELCSTYKEWSQRGLVERLRAPSAFLSSGRDRLVVVPNSRISVPNSGPIVTNGVYIVYSNDDGRSWKVIDITCDHLKEWVKAVYPAYDGYPAFVASVDRPTSDR